MFKELWTLVKMLFSKKPGEITESGLLGMDHFPFAGYSYMMWCGTLIYRNDTIERRKKEWESPEFKYTLNHEAIHLAQAKAMGSWFNYYKKYVWEWMKGGPIMAPASAAYYTVPFEMEAYGNERNLDYTKNYTLEHVQEGGKYYIKSDRKKFYKSFGGSREWKAYCKTL